MNKIVVLIILGCIFYSCRPTLYIPQSKDAVEQEQLMAGRNLYVKHCGGCHNLHLPKEYNAEQWKNNINEMQKRAKIGDDEKQAILKYLLNYQ